MACCGNNRRQFHQSAPASHRSGAPSGQAMRTGYVYQIEFEYSGKTSLTVRGPITGRVYSFDGLNARALVDVRDAPSVAGVPNLRRVPRSA